MNEKLSPILDEFIQIELNVAELYRIFHEAFPVDACFWWKLYLEEKNHAALCRSIKEIFLPLKLIPVEMFLFSLEEIKKANTKLLNLTSEFRIAPPSRGKAFNIALETEQSAGELHFQEFLDKKEKSTFSEILKQLNKDDKDHAKRILHYMEDQGIDMNK